MWVLHKFVFKKLLNLHKTSFETCTKSVKDFLQKTLDKRGMMWYNDQAVCEADRWAVCEADGEKSFEKTSKNFHKTY